VGVAVTSNLEANAHYFRAQQIMEQSLDSDRALAEYRQALALDPEFAQAHLQIALLMALGEAEGGDSEANAHLAAVLTLGERTPARDRRLAALLGEFRRSDGQGAAAAEKLRKLFRDAVVADPGSKELLALAGQWAVDQEDFALAVQYLEQALGLDPGYGPALVWLATALDKVGRPGDAVARARRAVAARPGPVTHAVLAQSLAVVGDRAAAAAAVQQVYTSGQEVPYFVSEMVWPVHAYVGDWKRAEAELRRWTGPGVLPARQTMAWSALAFLLNAQGRALEVRAIGTRLEEGTNPELARWAKAMADLLYGDTSGAARLFRQGGAVDLAAVVAYLGDLDGAAQLARGLEPGSVPAEKYRGVDAWKRGNPGAAITIFRGLIARTDDSGAKRYLGQILCEGGQAPEGAQLIDRWLQQFPSAVNLGFFVFRAEVLLRLARCQELQGRTAEARELVDQLLADWTKADPGLPLLVEARAMRSRLAATKK
jgi:tetratricopeptide (TPR) repeat protein